MTSRDEVNTSLRKVIQVERIRPETLIGSAVVDEKIPGK